MKRALGCLTALLLGLPAGADQDGRLQGLMQWQVGQELRFQLDPADSQLFLKDVQLSPLSGRPGSYALKREMLGTRSEQEAAVFRFHRDGFQDATVRLSWAEIRRLPDHLYSPPIRLQPGSLSGHFQRHPLLFLAGGGLAAAALGILLGRGRRAGQAEARNARFEQWSSGADLNDPFLFRKLDSYRLVARLGSGGMASVYRGVPDDSLDESQAVAIKIIRPGEDSPAYKERFLREIQVSKQLNHPNVVRVFGYGECDGLMYMAMELIDGQPLKDLIPAYGLAPEQAAGYLSGMLEGLVHAHGLGIVHRDLKPANVMVSKKGQVKLVDFGLARNREVQTLTVTGHALGTPAYMPPEQFAAGSSKTHLRPESDQYSFGVVAYQLLTGRLPFESDDLASLLMMHLRRPPTPIRQHQPALPAEVEAVLDRMLAKNPKDRYPSMQEAGEALLAALRRPSGSSSGAVRPETDETEELGGPTPEGWLATENIELPSGFSED